MTDRRKFEAGLGRLAIWVLVYGLLAGVTFIVADWLLDVLGVNGLGRTAVGVLAAVVAGWLGANGLERIWRRGDMADARETPQRR